ncbi:MAG TPA: fused MFS/spermidine synthase [Thermomicrobiales bacterium]|nr:fused MFS/spermidine synthase [Thermomicrobiales bacterium]
MSLPVVRCRWPGAIPVAAFVTGFASIAAEISASRLIAPYFGSSTFIWASLIGVTLLFLSIGYWLGGRVADEHPDARLLYLLIGAAAIAMALIVPISRPILRASLDAFDQRNAGAFLGSLVATLLLFAPVMLALGMVAPLAIRLRIGSVADAGKAAGSLYALSTAGSILGSFLPVIVLLPLLGTRWTFAILAIVMAVMSITGLLLERQKVRAMAAAAVFICALIAMGIGSRGVLKPPYEGTLIAELESDNNYIQVLQSGDATLLALNDGHAIHSIYNPNQLETGGPWDYFTLGPILTGTGQPQRALIVGLAGGTAARQLKAAYPEIQIDGVEVDQTIVDVARKYFALTPDVATVHVEDGRYFLETTDQTYDIIALDAYRQPYVPFHLATTEFFQLVAKHLNPGGVVIINAGRTQTDYRLVDALSATAATVFPTTAVIDVERYDNSMIFATMESVSLESFKVRLQASEPLPFVGDVAKWAVDDGKIRGPSTSGTILTDDKAPVEWIIDKIILDEAVREEP